MMLSENLFVRLEAASNHTERGQIEITVGRSATVKFSRPFDFPCKAVVTATVDRSEGFVYAAELYLEKTKMEVLTSAREPRPLGAERAKVEYVVYGLVDINQLPNWYALFYGGITNHQNGLFKAALMDYAVSFEVFLESYLSEKLSLKFGQAVSDYILRKTWRVEERSKELLELVSGHRLSERNDVYEKWDSDVRQVRNDLAHGKKIHVDKSESENAHQAVYQAIRWIQELR